MEMTKDQEEILTLFNNLKQTQKNCTELYEKDYPKFTKRIQSVIDKAGWNITADDIITLVASARLAYDIEKLKEDADDKVKEFVNDKEVLAIMASLIVDKEKEKEKKEK